MYGASSSRRTTASGAGKNRQKMKFNEVVDAVNRVVVARSSCTLRSADLCASCGTAGVYLAEPPLRRPSMPNLGPAVRFSSLGGSAHLKSLGTSGWSGVTGVAIDPMPRRKLIHFIRHAEGFHNIDPEVMKMQAGLDARLTDEGKSQCATLAKSIEQLRPQLIVTSPLARTVQTAALALALQIRRDATKMVALEHVRETVNYLCDARRPLSAIVGELDSMGMQLDVSACEHEHDELWASYERKHGSQQAFMAHRESADLPALAMRARRAFGWLAARPEQEIVVVTHSAFLWNVLNMERVGKRSGVEPICDYGGDFELEGWLSAKFENCEMRTVVAEFPEHVRAPG